VFAFFCVPLTSTTVCHSRVCCCQADRLIRFVCPFWRSSYLHYRVFLLDSHVGGHHNSEEHNFPRQAPPGCRESHRRSWSWAEIGGEAGRGKYRHAHQAHGPVHGACLAHDNLLKLYLDTRDCPPVVQRAADWLCARPQIVFEFSPWPVVPHCPPFYPLQPLLHTYFAPTRDCWQVLGCAETKMTSWLEDVAELRNTVSM